ncbi:hypothetical protein Halru_2172 [Halovivax ruber XH-70]|uniref:Uncharacterized protein n=1 Tax=Halovivax ruber (strain DSM 18193 / JCM 13892 / XH-70) TaxID=797302 RepID=L0IB07_HALRX|nr:hypothetical protein Halru_2172 [Halovivax ruber XH-70]
MGPNPYRRHLNRRMQGAILMAILMVMTAITNREYAVDGLQ